ncbi:asparaginase [Gordonia jinhuaensis]|uniref:asparaginase n=1 Tax=Gordonia jinhuaensis TaxID=1517702 RepID=A0A916SY75_9ACTN|nr:asparaginase [Gordonia jinhuaensis]GGB19483.1 L-asparaginase [Gordonia jinhuaensis]
MNSGQIVVVSTGGTIASTSEAGGAVPTRSGAQLVEAAHDHTTHIDRIRTHEVYAVDSSAVTVAQLDLLRREITAILRDDPDIDGIVVTHGTDTLEESAMLLDLVHDDPRPVILTGAQRTFDHPDADGPSNLSAALEAVSDPANRGRGVLVAFGDRLLPARGIGKVSTTDADAFGSVNPHLRRPLPRRDAAELASAGADIVSLYPAIDAGLLTAVAERGRDRFGSRYGMVLAGTGSGNSHARVTDVVRELTAGSVPVVVSTRLPFGEVEAVYGGGGGAVDLVAAGAILSPWLRPPQLRILLMDLLSRGADVAEIAEFIESASQTTD